MPEMEEIQEKEPWERMEGEGDRWFSLFQEYKMLGPTRNLRWLYRKKREENGKTIGSDWGAPSNWNQYSKLWKWKERASAWDDYIRKGEDVEVEQVLAEGLALSHIRITKLKLIADKIEAQILDPGNTRISPMLLEQYRGLLDDIAKEKGERVKETRLTGTKGGPITIQTEWGRGGSATDAWEGRAIEAGRDFIEAHIIEESL